MIISSIGDMLLGVILGMVASPLLMKLIKSLRQKYKVDRLLKKQQMCNISSDVSHTDSQWSKTP